MDQSSFANKSTLLEEQVLTTKLHMPPLSPYLVPRPRLLTSLTEGVQRKLTLISAPAGSGKTMLLSSWLNSPAGREIPFAWLSLDEGDNDPMRFWRYVWTALRQLHADAGLDLAKFQSQQSLPLTSLLTQLINVLSAIERPFAFILDDYHLITTPAIHQTMAFLLDHQPESLRLIISSRQDPPLPLARLRAHGQLLEIRTAELRFALSEAASFLTEVMGLHLKADDIALLEARTEGWITGLQLAALSLRERDPTQTARFLATFAGSHRYILDYLGEEVLQRQPAHVQQFLLQTSLLDRLSGPLCDAVTGSVNSQELLEELEQHNLFVIPLDEQRNWYRYHHLFAEVLRDHLALAQRQGKLPVSTTTLHERASVWYEQHHLLVDAIHHALAAEAFERAAHLCERVIQITLARGEILTLLHWFEQLPREVFYEHPHLSALYVHELIFSGRQEKARRRAEEANRYLLENAERLQPEERSLLTGILALIQAYFASEQEDLARTRASCQEAQQCLPDEHPLRGDIPLILGIVSWLDGETEQASTLLTEANRKSLERGNLYSASMANLFLAQMQIIQGHVQEAMALFHESFATTRHSNLSLEEQKPAVCMIAPPWPTQIGENDLLPHEEELLTSMASLLYEQNALEKAERYLQPVILLEQNVINARSAMDGQILLARIKQARGESEQARVLMEQAIQLAQQHQFIWTAVTPSIYATQAWLALAQGDLEAAASWAEDMLRRNASAARPTYPREVDRIMLARIQIAQGKHTEALRRLSQCYPAAAAGGRMRNALEILILQALGQQALGKSTEALSTLASALQLAEPEGYTRLFVNEGKPMATLLSRFRTERLDISHFVETLLAAFTRPKSISLSEDRQNRAEQSLEVLSAREFEVLQLVATGASNQEIAERLIVAESTIKKHLQNIFGKLGVSNRTQAIARARDLDLL